LPNVALFEGLPHKQLLTLNLDVPEAWMVQPIWSDHDLDNIRLALVFYIFSNKNFIFLYLGPKRSYCSFSIATYSS